MIDLHTAILDGNEAAALVAYRLAQVIAIDPITASSTMAEWAHHPAPTAMLAAEPQKAPVSSAAPSAE